MIERLRARNEWKFALVLPQADRALAVAWWTLLVLRGLLPALLAIAMGALVGAAQRGRDLTAPIGLVGVVFVLLQNVFSPQWVLWFWPFLLPLLGRRPGLAPLIVVLEDGQPRIDVAATVEMMTGAQVQIVDDLVKREISEQDPDGGTNEE